MSKEDKLLSLYNRMVSDANKGDQYALEWVNAIEDTLNILQIQVKGIN